MVNITVLDIFNIEQVFKTFLKSEVSTLEILCTYHTHYSEPTFSIHKSSYPNKAKVVNTFIKEAGKCVFLIDEDISDEFYNPIIEKVINYTFVIKE